MTTKKFWCHYIGADGNTPKRRSIELVEISELLPNVSNEGVRTPVWYEHDSDYYILYAQLSDKVAVRIRTMFTIHDRMLNEYLLKTDEDIDREYEERMAITYSKERIAFDHMTEERVARGKASWRQSYDDKKKYRDARFAEIRRFQDYEDYLLTGKVWISIAAIKAFEEAKSPFLPMFQEIRRQALAEREAEERKEREERRKAAEEKARKEAEEERQEQERLTKEAEKFKNGESIAGADVVELCRRYGIAIHLRTVHNLQQVIVTINGKEGTCQYYRSRGKRRPQLDGCYETASKLYNHLQTELQ